MSNAKVVVLSQSNHRVKQSKAESGEATTYAHEKTNLAAESSVSAGTFFDSNQHGSKHKDEINDAALTGYIGAGLPFSILIDGGYGAGDHSGEMCGIISDLLPVAIEKLQKQSKWQELLPRVLETLLKAIDVRAKAFVDLNEEGSFQCNFAVQFTFEDTSKNIQCVSMGVGDSLSAIYRARTKRYETTKSAFNTRDGGLDADAIRTILNEPEKGFPESADRLPSNGARNTVSRLIQGMDYSHTVLNPGDMLVQMTDGVHEFLGANDKELSAEKKGKITYFKTRLAPLENCSPEELLERCKTNRNEKLERILAKEAEHKPVLNWLDSTKVTLGHSSSRTVEQVLDDIIQLNDLDATYDGKAGEHKSEIDRLLKEIKESESKGYDFEEDIKTILSEVNAVIDEQNKEQGESNQLPHYKISENIDQRAGVAEEMWLKVSSGRLKFDETKAEDLKEKLDHCQKYFGLQSELETVLTKTGFAAVLKNLIALKEDRDGKKTETTARQNFYDKLTEAAKTQFGDEPDTEQGDKLDWAAPKAVKEFFAYQRRQLQVSHKFGDDFMLSTIRLAAQDAREDLVQACLPEATSAEETSGQVSSVNEKPVYVSFDKLDRFFQKHFKALQDATEALNAVEPKNVDPTQANDGVAYQQYLDAIDEVIKALHADQYAPGLYQLAEVIKAANHLRFSGLTQDQKRAGCAVHVGLFHIACEAVKTAYAWFEAHKDYMSPELQNTLHVSLAQLATNLKEFYNYFCEKNAWAKIYRAYAEQVDSNEKISASFFSSPNYEAQFEEKSKLHYADKTNEDGVVISDGIVSITEKLQRALPEADGSCNLVKPAAILNGSTKEVAQLAGLPRPRTGSASSA